MTKSIAPGYTDTAIEGFTALGVNHPAINWSEDFRVLSDQPGEVVLINVVSPVDQPETVRFAQRKVNNVYAGTDIDPSAYLPSRQGTATVVQVRDVLAETSSTDENHRLLAPISCGITLTAPSYVGITPDIAANLLKRAFACFFEEADATTDGVDALLHGVLKKKAL